MLTPKETELLRSALGLHPRSKTTCKNEYRAGSFDIARWRGLVARGYAIEGSSTKISTAFHVTRKGFEAVKKNGEKLGPDEERAMRQREAEAA
jgi:hypothetical protein